MLLRSFQLSDVHDVSRIWQLTASRDSEWETLQELSKQLARDRDLVLVAEVDGRIVGAIVGTMDRSTGFFYCLAVHPDYQGRGIGRRLVASLEERFRQKGVKRIWITIDEGTRKLLPFYLHLGYANICDTTLEKELMFQNGRVKGKAHPG
ncbi:putative N-acetyltransferase YhbS [Planifilum fimeticola]|jgi:ribosomal protein S18 acetylase RimI-like enzyme|uniref:Putative N-acetyltransferase YhbS n=1 Tax=Planifilum fimeticola TaxID=201975 RepID=A0A2T0LDP7_9BACL|nr:GNAT family N-acetyltransferase [Planifilum fimeticola]PRX40166.1 putative N-acetyltransferase YhbS [Planifilum fimeticola]